MDSERAGRRYLSRNRAAEALGMTPVEQIVEIVSASRPAERCISYAGNASDSKWSTTHEHNHHQDGTKIYYKDWEQGSLSCSVTAGRSTPMPGKVRWSS